MYMQKLELFQVEKIAGMIEDMQHLFQIVRIIDPSKTAIVTIDKNLEMHWEDYTCYKVWKRDTRCERCSSIRAAIENCPVTKYELLDQAIFHVLSHPILIEDKEHRVYKMIFELVQQIDTTEFLELDEKRTIEHLLKEKNHTTYEDELTGAYNRSYFDAFMYVYHNNVGVPKRVAFLMLDIADFRKINEDMGYKVGDKVLIDVTKMLKDNTRAQDSVIRIGGDEFLITLSEYSEEEVRRKVRILNEELEKIFYDATGKHHVAGDFGYSYTPFFEILPEYASDLLETAGKWMCNAKKERLEADGIPVDEERVKNKFAEKEGNSCNEENNPK